MARWSRAARWLDLPAGSRVLDLGCAFGFGTRLLARRYETHGHDLDAAYIHRALRSVPQASFTVGPADSLPYPDSYFDGLVLLDVLEHVPDDAAVIAEVGRVLRPGGRFVLSVPNRGVLSGLDSLNIYARWFGSRAPAPTDDPSWEASPRHRHYAVDELEAQLGAEFKVLRVGYTGFGIAEALNLLLLVLFKRVFALPETYRRLQYAYFGIYLLEDVFVTGPWGYHLMLLGERTGVTGASDSDAR